MTRKKHLLTFCLLFFSTLTFAHFSNMIVFGDSLSDVGNFPESSQIWWDDQKPKTLLNAVAQLYVPFANPVDTTSKNTENFPWPTLDNRYLTTQTRIDGNARRYRSIGWTQFFLSLANYKKTTHSAIIVPSTLLSTRKIPLGFSINYAWGYATSDSGCVNPHYEHATCDAVSIDTARNHYRDNPSKDNYLKLEVPGLSEQISLFKQNLKNHKISVDTNTLYAVWIGGNDLISGSIALHHYNPLPAVAAILGSSAQHIIRNINALLATLPANKRPEKIYVFSLFNPGLTPAFYDTPITGFGKFVVRCENFFLRFDAGFFNLFSTTKIIIVPSDSWYQIAAENPTFKKTLGQSCQIGTGKYNSVTEIPRTNCENYLFWNDVHPATPMQAKIASGFFLIHGQDR